MNDKASQVEFYGLTLGFAQKVLNMNGFVDVKSELMRGCMRGSKVVIYYIGRLNGLS